MKIIKEINKEEAKEFLYNIDLNDEYLYQELNDSNTIGIFQMGNTASDIVKRIKPRSFDDLNAVNALARPGTSSFVDDYIKGRDEDEKKYPEQINQLLHDSNGVCLVSDSKIKTDIGDISISYIVENKLDIKILTKNENNGKLEWKEILSYFDNGEKEIIELELEDGRILSCTEDHLVKTRNRGWVEAINLNFLDDVIIYEEEI